MATRRGREIQEGLTKKGFIAVQRHHTFLFLTVEGRKSSVHTKISHGNKEFGDNVLSLVARQLHISAKQLDDLLDCPLSREGYISLLREKKILAAN